MIINLSDEVLVHARSICFLFWYILREWREGEDYGVFSTERDKVLMGKITAV